MASAIIPHMKMICIFFEKSRKKELFEGLGSTVSAWKNSVKNRFSIYFTDKNLVLATYLDPRFKITFLEDDYNNIKVEDILKQWMCEDICCIKERKTVSTTLNQFSDFLIYQQN